MISIFGGVYTERCIVPHWNQIYGSGGRAAAALSSLSDEVRLSTYLTKRDEVAFKSVAAAFNFTLDATKSNEGISFDYFHGLSTPIITPAPKIIGKEPSIKWQAECVLRFGYMEGDAIVLGNRVIYDPQSPNAPEAFAKNGSQAKQLAYVLNKREGSLLTGHSEPAMIVKQLHDEHEAEVIVLKMGAEGALVSADKQLTLVPCIETKNVWPIGSGDVFAAVFAHFWGERKDSPVDAAVCASKAAAYYCNTSSLPVPQNVDDHLNGECKPTRYVPRKTENVIQVYLAGPFFNIAERWLIEEIRNELYRGRLQVFSPLHDVGFGGAMDVAEMDLKGIDDSQIVFAIINGLDPGTIYEIGYARAKGIPVVVLSQNEKSEDLKMIEGSGCIVEEDLVKAIYKTMWVAKEL